MNRQILTGILIILLSSSMALADRILERAEILQLFQQLTVQGQRTWISAGTIEATRQQFKAAKELDLNAVNRKVIAEITNYTKDLNKIELAEELQKMRFDAIPFNVRYELSNEFTMNSTELLKYDGKRFYWEINVETRSDSLKPGIDLINNSMTEHFDLDSNKKRIFVWDGERYTKYFQSSSNAIVDARPGTQHPVNGFLTAGIVPWGYGYYTYENLSKVESSAIETSVAGETLIQLTLAIPNGGSIICALSPSKNYALASFLMTGKKMTFRKYSDYRLVDSKWIPMTILIEEYDAATNRLLARDLWSISRIDSTVPGIENFYVDYDTSTQVEFMSPVTANTAKYHNSGAIDTESLLAERLTFASSRINKNCATAALKHAFSKLGKEISQEELASLATSTTGSTSLASMAQFAKSKGFYTRAVKTDIQTLKDLKGCQAILYIPGKAHFILLEAIDDKYVWAIDLSSDKFYYRTDKDFFGMDWTDGVALLISSQPISQQGNFTDLSGDELTKISAAGYECSKIIQDANFFPCPTPINGTCEGYAKEYFQRWGCATAPAGSCSTSTQPRFIAYPCIKNTEDFDQCDPSGDWTIYNIRACN